jgi:hypothetical protein
VKRWDTNEVQKRYSTLLNGGVYKGITKIENNLG